MVATIIISVILGIYSAFMIRRSFRSLKSSLKGQGCEGCSSDCNTCNAVVDFKFE